MERIRGLAAVSLVVLFGSLLVRDRSLAAPLQQDCKDKDGTPIACTDTPKPSDTKKPPPPDTDTPKPIAPSDTPKPTVLGPSATPSATLKPTVLGATFTSTPTRTSTVGLGSLVPPIEVPLTIVPLRGEIPHFDVPPIVTILSPAAEARVTGDEVQIRVRIREDVSLRTVQFINNGLTWTQSFWPVPGSDPQLYEAAVNLRAVPFDRSQSLIARAYDSIGQMGEALVFFTRVRPPIGDIEVTDLEITQAVQCLDNPTCPDNSIPLYINKPTLVRAYVRMASGAAPSIPVYGRICLDATGVCVPSIGGLSGLTAGDPVALHRGEMGLTLNFLLPLSFINRTGDVGTLTVHVNEPGGIYPPIAEADLSNNHRSIRVSFRDSADWQIRYSNVSDDSFFTPDPNGEMNRLVRWLIRVYPINPLRLRAWIDPPFIGSYNFQDTSGSSCGSGWDALIMDLFWRRLLMARFDHVTLYGMVDSSALVDAAYIGCGSMVTPNAGGIVRSAAPGPEYTGAQEIGHSFGRNHAPGCDAGGPDMAYPRAEGFIDEYGTDTVALELHPPTSARDFMGYCGPDKWVSRYTYLALGGSLRAFAPSSMGVLAAPALAPSADEPNVEILLASGQVSHDGIAFDGGFYRMTLPESVLGQLPSGPYSAEVLDASGATLGTAAFGPLPLSNDSPTDIGKFVLAIPVSGKAMEARFTFGGLEIGRMAATAGTPSVELVSPVPGEAWPAAGTVNIHWNGVDPDGDALSYLVQFSADGVSWMTLGQNLTGTSLAVDTALLSGSNSAHLRVLATDGLNSALAENGGGLSVPGKPPSVSVVIPDPDWVGAPGMPVFLMAMGADGEDGPLGESAFSWSSDRDGDLGAGPLIAPQNLSVGEHSITVTAVDSEGNSATDSIHITIFEPQIDTLDITERGGLPLGVELALAGGILLVVVAVLYLRLRRRRA